jgi:hypothetical protein
MRSKILLLVTVSIALLLACGCMSLPSSGDMPGFSENYASDMDGFEESGAGAPAYKSANAPSPLTQTDAASDDIGRKMIMTGSIELEVPEVEPVVDDLAGLADGHGGYVSSSSLRKNPDGRDYATVVLRVPGGEFAGTIEEIRSFGTVISQNTNANDVTEEYIDLEARLAALDAQLAQYQRIMEKAETVEDILKIQIQIERVQVEIERIAGRMKYLDDRIDYATITVLVTEPTPVGGDIGHDFAEVFNEAIRAFLTTIDLLIIAFFGLLPLILVAGGAWTLYRMRRGKSAQTGGSETKSEKSEEE